MNEVNAADTSGGFNYTCIAKASIGELNIDMKVNPTISVPSTVGANETITIESVVTNIELDLSGALEALSPLINPFKGNVDYFNMEVNGQTKNVLGNGGTPIPSTPHSPGDKFVGFTVQGSDTEFTVGDKQVDIKAGEILAQIASPIGNIPATCTPDANYVIATVDIEAQDQVDKVAPVITLKGESTVELELGATYEELGAAAEDDVDGNVSSSIKVTGNVDTSKVGVYEVIYTVSDAAGNEAKSTRTVHVIDPNQKDKPDKDSQLDEKDKPGEDSQPIEGDASDESSPPIKNEHNKQEENKKSNGNNKKDNIKSDENEKDESIVIKENSSNKPGTLPNTATNNPLLFVIGTSLLLVGGVTLAISRRKIVVS